MMNVRSLALAALAALGTACGGSSNPLVGDWTIATTTGGETSQTTYEVNGDGTLAVQPRPRRRADDVEERRRAVLVGQRVLAKFDRDGATPQQAATPGAAPTTAQ